LCTQVVFSPDSETLVTVESPSRDSEALVRAWRISADRKRVRLVESMRRDQVKTGLSPAGHKAESTHRSFHLSDILAVTPEDASFMAVSLESGEIEVYPTGNGNCMSVCRVVGDEVIFVPRTNFATPYSSAEVADIGRLACKLSGRAHARAISEGVPVLRARFSRDGRVVAVYEKRGNSGRGALHVIDVGTGRTYSDSSWGDVLEACSFFEFTPSGDELVIGGFGASLRVWDYRASRAPASLKGHANEVWDLAFSPDGTTLVSSSDDGTIKLWDVAAGLEQTTLRDHSSLVTAVAYSPDGTLLASAGWDSKVRLWKARGGAPLATLEGHTGQVFAVAFSPDGKTLASAGHDRTIRLWDVAKGCSLGSPLAGHTDRVFSVVFAADGETLFSGALDRTIRLWDWKGGRLRTTWPAEDTVLALTFSPDGGALAAAQSDGKLRLFDIAEQQARAPLRGHAGDVLAVAFSPDGLTLASAGRDQSVRLWDPVTGHELLTLKAHTSPVHAIAFSPDGTILATGSHDGSIKLWRASAGSTSEETTRRNLSRASSY
jgi:WD40 repeat protein